MTLPAFFARSRAFGLARRDMAAIVGLALAVAAFEAVGVGLMLPVLQFVQDSGRACAPTCTSGATTRATRSI